MTDNKEGMIPQVLAESAFSLYYDSSGSLTKKDHPVKNHMRLIDYSLPYEARLERECVHVFGEDPKILVPSLFHGDESVVSLMVKNTVKNQKLPAVVIPFVHPLAGIRNTREYDTGRGKIDINRIFKFNLEGKPKTYDEVIRQINYPEAKLLLEVCKMYPDLKYVFPIHMDVSKGKDMALGPYMYYTPYSDENDQDKQLVEKIFAQFRNEINRAGFIMHSGKDDILDPKLGNDVVNGFCYDPCIKEGVKADLGSFDEALVRLGDMGINKVMGSFNLEIPKYVKKTKSGIKLMYRTEEQRKIIDLFFKHFVVPFLKEKEVIK